jgi:hypothetical protein
MTEDNKVHIKNGGSQKSQCAVSLQVSRGMALESIRRAGGDPIKAISANIHLT